MDGQRCGCLTLVLLTVCSMAPATAPAQSWEELLNNLIQDDSEQPAEEPSLGGVWTSNANLLTSADVSRCDPVLGQWSYRSLRCRVYRADDGDNRSTTQQNQE